MIFFRSNIIRSIFLFVTGLTFLNMSFFMAEVSMLRSAYDKAAMENIARMICASMTEEETDHSETAEGAGAVKVIDFLQGNFYHLQVEQNEISNTLKLLGPHSQPHSGYLQIETPPPDSFVG